MVEQVRHPMMMSALLVDAASVHLADQGVPLLPSRPPLPSLPPPPLLAQPGFHAARTSLQPSNRASIPTILGLTPSLHHTDLTIIWAQGPTQPLSSMVPRLLSHSGGGGRNWIPGQCGVNPASYWSNLPTWLLIGRKLSAILFQVVSISCYSLAMVMRLMNHRLGLCFRSVLVSSIARLS